MNLNDQNLTLLVTYLRFITFFHPFLYFSDVFNESTVCGLKFYGKYYPEFLNTAKYVEFFLKFILKLVDTLDAVSVVGENVQHGKIYYWWTVITRFFSAIMFHKII